MSEQCFVPSLPCVSNLHTHTRYCDGCASAAVMAEAALAAGLRTLGFSGHSTTPFDRSYCMSEGGTLAYLAELRALAARYAGRLEIAVGLECDAYSPFSALPPGLDFRIGSLHYLRRGQRYYAIDESASALAHCLDEAYQGNALAMCADYYQQLLAMVRRLRPQVVGHFDLLRKYNQGRFFDEQAEPYRRLAATALAVLCREGRLVEVNTAAWDRLGSFYPDDWLLAAFAPRLRLILAADAHHPREIQRHFALALSRLRALGYRQLWQYRDGDFRPYAI